MEEIQIEREKLKTVLEQFKEVIEDYDLKIGALPRMYGQNPDLLANFLSMYTKKLELLKKTSDKPYFARIDFKDDNSQSVEQCYIGKVGVSDPDNKLITVDWRAPISSMYYDSNVGRASYIAPGGEYTGELLIKRQYDIENGILNSYQDVDTVSNDEILKPYLGVNADNRLKNIVSTIQSEQNEIIREKLLKNIIVQGVAGSGKTTVALHRIAYLVYNNINNIKPEQYLVIGPNKFFVNYISGVLPDLDVNNVNQLTYDEIIQELLNENFELLSDENKLIKSINDPDKLFFEKLRVSLAYKNAIDKFLKDFDKNVVPNIDFNIKDYKIIPNNIIKKIYDEIENDSIIDYSVFSKKVDRTCLLLGKYIQDNYETISSKIREQFYKKIENMPKSDIQKERKNLEYVEKELRNNCNQSLKKYFSKANPKILNLYIEFLKNIENYISVDDYKISEYSKKIISNIKSKKVEFEDLAALLYLKYRISGSNRFDRIRHVVVDEAQDFGEFNFYTLKKLMPQSTFSIFGDIAQSIYQYRGINNWDNVINNTFSNNCDLKYLRKSYRTTTEIMNSANNITEHIGLKTAEPVIRHGIDVSYNNCNDDQIDTISEYIKEYVEKGYSSIAVICKDKNEADNINNSLKQYNINIENITDSDTEYKGGICTITSYLAKGLEFDGVIISDASERKYSSSKSIDMKLLYVSMTRPLHELRILYSGELTKALQEDLKKKVIT
ncbi:MAG: AAA family ATPase [Bacilli bacterium]|nr:AAA family ATPase [Bacilli bacterium]